MVGTPEQIAESLRLYAQNRVSEFIVRDHRDMNVEEARDMMSILTADVIPHLG